MKNQLDNYELYEQIKFIDILEMNNNIINDIISEMDSDKLFQILNKYLPKDEGAKELFQQNFNYYIENIKEVKGEII